MKIEFITKVITRILVFSKSEIDLHTQKEYPFSFKHSVSRQHEMANAAHAAELAL